MSATGNDGWLSTGAITDGSTNIAKPNPPVRHIPTTPTPGPPHRTCSDAARPRSQPVTRLSAPTANSVNSLETHALRNTLPIDLPVFSTPGSPKRWGIATLHPAATTARAKSATFGVIPGISAITMTHGPVPERKTSWVTPSWVNEDRAKSARASGTASTLRRRSHEFRSPLAASRGDTGSHMTVNVSTVRLSKYHGLGNDFLVFVVDPGGRDLLEDEHIALAIASCDRHRGIGADGLLVCRVADAGADPQADLAMRLRNADGSLAEMSGNGIRCFVHAALDAGLCAPGTVRVATDGGLRVVSISAPDAQAIAHIEVAMGDATLNAVEIPAKVRSVLGDRRATTVSVGNPHIVIEAHPSTVDLPFVRARSRGLVSRYRPPWDQRRSRWGFADDRRGTRHGSVGARRRDNPSVWAPEPSLLPR